MEEKDVIRFWFEESSPEQWFSKDEDFDKTVKSKFIDTYYRIVNGETKGWQETPCGRLAEIIVLDQFSRNMFRDSPQAFEHDALALSLAKEAVAVGDDKKLNPTKRRFLYMPYMHSESREVHKKAIWLFLSLPFSKWMTVWYEYKHKKIIDKFGRYPHRNKILGRTSTQEEIEFLKNNPGF